MSAKINLIEAEKRLDVLRIRLRTAPEAEVLAVVPDFLKQSELINQTAPKSFEECLVKLRLLVLVSSRVPGAEDEAISAQQLLDFIENAIAALAKPYGYEEEPDPNAVYYRAVWWNTWPRKSNYRYMGYDYAGVKWSDDDDCPAGARYLVCTEDELAYLLGVWPGKQTIRWIRRGVERDGIVEFMRGDRWAHSVARSDVEEYVQFEKLREAELGRSRLVT